jgi:hypothetical protein
LSPSSGTEISYRLPFLQHQGTEIAYRLLFSHPQVLRYPTDSLCLHHQIIQITYRLPLPPSSGTEICHRLISSPDIISYSNFVSNFKVLRYLSTPMLQCKSDSETLVYAFELADVVVNPTQLYWILSPPKLRASHLVSCSNSQPHELFTFPHHYMRYSSW